MSHTIKAENGPLSSKILDKGISNRSKLLSWLESLPYRRTSTTGAYHLVIDEECGTCSTKHALVKAIANENQWPDTDLYVGFFAMDSDIFPALSDILNQHELDYIPEAHTFLVIDGEYTDVSIKNSPITADHIFEEMEIEPENIGQMKESIHKGFIQEWIEEEKVSLPFSEIWKIREACIMKLSSKS